MIWDVNNMNKTKCGSFLEVNKLKKDSVADFQELLISNNTKKHEEMNDTLQIMPIQKNIKETQLKYILEVFGPKSDEMSIIGTARFRGINTIPSNIIIFPQIFLSFRL